MREVLVDVIPRAMAFDQARDGRADLVLVRSDLFGGVPIAQGESVVFERLEVDGDAQRSPELVVAGVAFADAGGGIVDAVGDPKLAQLLAEPADQGHEIGVVR